MLRFSKLRIAGFKSFVDPIELLIEPGLTGIVGPNGCGKSNLVEALRWVMGETSAKQMRGGEMDDVIFAGSNERASRNIAEVCLELDNSAGTAPPPWGDADELLVSRRIERARGSSFRVNGRVSIDDVNEALGVELPQDEWDTVGGLLLGLAGEIPREGQELRHGDLRLKADKIVGRRIKSVLITREPPEETAPGSEEKAAEG